MNFNLEKYKNQNIEELAINPHFANILQPNDTVLDIGGAVGGFLEALNSRVCPIVGTVMETDRDCIAYGKKKYPHIKFCYGKFPIPIQTVGLSRWIEPQYDYVIMRSLFPHFVNWREALKTMACLAAKGLYFNTITRLNGTTLADDELSYFYYLNTGKRVAQVIHNVYEFVSFLCLEEIKAKQILCVSASTSRHRERPGDYPEGAVLKSPGLEVFRGVSPFETYKSDWVLQLHAPENNPKRMGGGGQEISGYHFYIPDTQVWIDGEFLFGAENNQWVYRIPVNSYQ